MICNAFAGDRNTKVCGPAKIECYRMAERVLLTSNRAKAFREKCNCLQVCRSLDYGGNIDRIESDMLVVHKSEEVEEKKEKGYVLLKPDLIAIL